MLTKDQNRLTLRRVRSVLNRRFGGVIKAGKHKENGECCILELNSVLRGIDWTDDPHETRCFDLRALNDIQVSDELRTEWMTRVLVAYDGSLDWPEAKQQGAAERLIVLIVQRIIAPLPMLRSDVAAQCRNAQTLTQARAAAYAARAAADAAYATRATRAAYAAYAARAAYAAADAAAYAADAAAYAAYAADATAYAAYAAAYAARGRVFIAACQCFLDAVRLK